MENMDENQHIKPVTLQKTMARKHADELLLKTHSRLHWSRRCPLYSHGSVSVHNKLTQGLSTVEEKVTEK